VDANRGIQKVGVEPASRSAVATCYIMSYLFVQLHHFELQETMLGHLQVSKF